MTGATRLGRRDVRALIIGGTILVTALAARGVPAWRAWTASSRASADLALAELDAARTAIALLPTVRDSLAARRALFASLGPSLLLAANPGTAAADLGSAVASAARTAGLSIGNVSVRGDTSTAQAYARPSARGDARGDIAGLVQFLLSIELGPPHMAVRQLTVTQPEPGAPAARPEELRIEFVVEALAPTRRTPTSRVARIAPPARNEGGE
jgi:hypothetical protein